MITIDGTIGHGTPLRRVTESFGNEVVGLRGPNGSGKTTLLKTLAGLVPIVEGAVAFDGMVVDDTARFVHPERRLARYVDRDPFPASNLTEFLAFPLRCAGIRRSERDATITRTIERFALDDLVGVSPSEMSQGQLARVTIARACTGHARAVFLDEPFRGLDESNKQSMLELLATELRRVGLTAIVVSHDRSDLVALCDRVVDFD